MERPEIPATGLVLVGVYIALNRLIEYAEYVQNPPRTELGFLAELVTGGFLIIAGGLVALGVISYRRNWIAVPSAVLVGTIITLLTLEVRLYSRIPQSQSDILIWLLISAPPTIGTWALLRRYRPRPRPA